MVMEFCLTLNFLGKLLGAAETFLCRFGHFRIYIIRLFVVSGV